MSLSVVENIDCMTRMREAPDNHWDLAICDPPYGIGESGGKHREGPQSFAKGLRSAIYAKKAWDSATPTSEYFSQLGRVSRNQIIWGGNYFELRPSPCFIVWDKKTNDGSDFADCELAWTSFSSAVRKFKYDWVGFGYINNPDGEKKIHPTQKPVALYKWLLQNYAKPGDTILDTHMGSQSSRIAAWDLGFDFTGFELDEDYYKAGCERFEIHTAQAKLFDAPVLETVEQNNLF